MIGKLVSRPNRGRVTCATAQSRVGRHDVGDSDEIGASL